ncbi:MAG: phosphoribosylanthranilate isomerase, partial [Bacillota bacterium]
LCCQLGVNALGFIMAESPRYIEIEKVAEISRDLSPFTSKVAVVMNPGEKLIRKIIKSNIFDYIQFHGEEDPDLISSVPIKTIKTISIDTEDNSGLEEMKKYKNANYFLFDSKYANKKGGTGKKFDWSILNKLNINKPYILAGGLSVDNIEEAITTLNMNGLDLNSKLELSPGIKDHNLIKKTVKIIRDFQINNF